MPRVAEFFGIAIYIYGYDHNPPHVHVFYAEYESKVDIQTGDELVGDVPPKQLRRAQDWIADNRADLLARWVALNP